MKYLRAIAFAALAGTTIVTATGCAVARDQQTVGAYVDDAAITTAVKAKLVEDKTVSAGAISVETLNGTGVVLGEHEVRVGNRKRGVQRTGERAGLCVPRRVLKVEIRVPRHQPEEFHPGVPGCADDAYCDHICITIQTLA